MAAAKKAAKNAKRRGRRTYAETFTDKIAELTGAEGGLVTNQNLRSALGWDEDRYKRIKEQLRGLVRFHCLNAIISSATNRTPSATDAKASSWS